MRRGLGERAWRALEAPQGNSFLSDAMQYCSDEEVADFLRVALPDAEKVVKVMRRLLKLHESTPSPEDR